jgi:3'(2'), 5'-bisphosphate nucleotidase
VTHDDHALARDLATEAGALLLRLRSDRGFGDLRALRDAGDRESHIYLTEALARQRPGDSVLSEEGKDELSRLSAERVWIVDPLDGTREYAEEGRGDWAVHVALWERAGGLRAGAVALPAQGRTLSTAEPHPLPEPGTGRIRIAVSRTRPPEFTRRLADHVDAEVDLIPIGSAGAKVAAVLLGEVDAYVHAGGQYEWDSAAPVAVAHAAGAHASRIDGSSLTYNQEDTNLPDILVCHPELAPTLLAGIRAVL